LIVSWILFPLLLIALSLGCGLLVRAAVRLAIPGTLLAPLGLAVLIVLGELVTIVPAAAVLYTPAALAAAAVGVVLTRRWERPEAEAWAVMAAAVVFAVYAAPIVLGGEATFAGYVKLDDTATWLAITDRIVEHGRDLDGLAPSTYEATLSFNLGSGYPIGAFLPLGLGSEITGTDPAWLFQPYMAVLAVMLALSLYAIAGALIDSPRLRAAAVVLAAQPALLFSFYLWGGVKEMASVALLAALASLLPVAFAGWRSWRNVLPAVVVGAAVIAVLSPGGAGIWLGPALLLALYFAVRSEGVRRAALSAAYFAGALAVISLPWLVAGGFAPRDAGALTDPRELGNLIEPLSVWQGVGVWPVGDFRLDPVDPGATVVLILVVLAAAVACAVIALKRSAFVPAIFCGALLLGTAGLVLLGSPWVDAKGLATLSPALLFAGAAGSAALIDRGSVIEGGIALVAIAIGVLWSNALAYEEVWLAPSDRLEELEQVGELIEGEGPALMTEYEPFGVRHFLRDADPEGASELRRRIVPLSDGTSLGKGETADIDRFDVGGLLEYRTLVLRRSPLASRPPLPFELAWEGEHYEVWQAPPGSRPPLRFLGVGDTGPVAEAPCDELRVLAATPGIRSLAVSTRPQPAVVPLGRLELPVGWGVDAADPAVVYPDGSGAATGFVGLPEGGTVGAWIGGSFRGEVELLVDGGRVGVADQGLDHGGGFTSLGRLPLDPGRHEVSLRYEAGGLGPGRGGVPFGLGPLVFSRATATGATLRLVPPEEVAALCGRPLDWAAAVG
jgi:hypothetical protein